VSSYIERLRLDQRFAGRGDNALDRLKRLRAEGWDLTVLIEYAPNERGVPKATGQLIVLGWRPEAES
jgi:hypothetical protein